MADDQGRPVEVQTEAYTLIQRGDRGRALVYSAITTREVTTLVYAMFRREIAQTAMQPAWDAATYPLGGDWHIVLRSMLQAGLAVDRRFELQTRHDDRWTRRTWTFDHANLAGGFGLGFAGQCMRILPLKYKAAGFIAYSTRLLINWHYKLHYVRFLYGWRSVLKKTSNVYHKFHTRRHGTDIDRRTA